MLASRRLGWKLMTMLPLLRGCARCAPQNEAESEAMGLTITYQGPQSPESEVRLVLHSVPNELQIHEGD